MPASKLHAEYLTRTDVARILNISSKQAGRLMEQMRCVLIGKNQRRVSRPDFELWIEHRKFEEESARMEKVDRAAIIKAGNRHRVETVPEPYFSESARRRALRKPRFLPL